MEETMSVSAIQDAFADALRRIEVRHKAHVEATGDTGDWIPFYSAALAIEFAGVRIPLESETLPVIATVTGHMTVPDATGDSTPIPSEDSSGNVLMNASNRKWEPVEREEPCFGYGCE
jgi:hypothetical protein